MTSCLLASICSLENREHRVLSMARQGHGRAAHGRGWGERPVCLRTLGAALEEAGGHPEKEPERLPSRAPESCSVLTGATAHFTLLSAAAACTNSDQTLPRMLRINPSRLARLPTPPPHAPVATHPFPHSAPCLAPASGPCTSVQHQSALPPGPISHYHLTIPVLLELPRPAAFPCTLLQTRPQVPFLLVQSI